MSGEFIGALILGVFGTGGVATIITILANRKKVNAEELHLRAQGEELKASTQAQVIDDLQSENARMKQDMSDIRGQLKALEAKERINALIMLNLTLWTHKAYAVMTDEQRDRVGNPPVDNETLDF